MLSIVDADDAGHRLMRRLQRPAFSERALRAQEGVVQGYVDLLVRRLRGRAAADPATAAAVVDLTAWYSFAAFDIVGDLAFGAPFHCLRDAVWHWWLDAVFDLFHDGVLRRAARRFAAPLPPLLAWLLVPRKLARSRADQFRFTVERVDRRLRLATDRPDFCRFSRPGP